MATGQRIEVVGLADLRRDLEGMPKDIQDAFKREMKSVAEIVARDAARRVPSKTGEAISGIATKGEVGGASVIESRSQPYLRWLDFGSRTPRTGNTRAEGPWRGSGTGPKGGRFLYPAIEANWDEVRQAADEAIARAAREAGFH